MTIFSYKEIKNTLGILTIALFMLLGMSSALAWTDPTVAPTGGNSEGPLTVADTNQGKLGKIILNINAFYPIGLKVNQGTYFDGNIGIGRDPLANGAKEVELAGAAHATLDVCTDLGQIPGYTEYVELTGSGSFSWTVPPGVSSYDVAMWGGGGGGGNALKGTAPSTSVCSAGGGGGSGAYAEKIVNVVTPGQVVSGVIGQGGTAGGGNGGDTTGLGVTAGGGRGGASSATQIGGVGGTVTGPATKTRAGGAGANGGLGSNTFCVSMTGGTGGSAPVSSIGGGMGGKGGQKSPYLAPVQGYVAGGGGGGAGSGGLTNLAGVGVVSGASGAQGKVVIFYTFPPVPSSTCLSTAKFQTLHQTSCYTTGALKDGIAQCAVGYYVAGIVDQGDSYGAFKGAYCCRP